MVRGGEVKLRNEIASTIPKCRDIINHEYQKKQYQSQMKREEIPEIEELLLNGNIKYA